MLKYGTWLVLFLLYYHACVGSCLAPAHLAGFADGREAHADFAHANVLAPGGLEDGLLRPLLPLAPQGQTEDAQERPEGESGQWARVERREGKPNREEHRQIPNVSAHDKTRRPIAHLKFVHALNCGLQVTSTTWAPLMYPSEDSL